MKLLGGILLILLGISLGLYVGLYLMFIGGIAGLIHECQLHQPVNGMVIAINIVRILFAGLVGVICVWAGVVPGCALLIAARTTRIKQSFIKWKHDNKVRFD